MQVVATFDRNEQLQKQVMEQFPNIEFYFYKNIKEAAERLENAEVLITYGEDLTEAVVNKCKQLKWIMVVSAGLEKMPFEALKKRNIIVTNARGIHKIPMAEFACGFMLLHAKQFHTFKKQQDQAYWNKRVTLNELYGGTLAVVGAGAIGSQIGKYAKGFGMKTIGINSGGKETEGFDETYPIHELNEILPMADYVISVLPSTPSTKGIYTRDKFKLMKETAVFINLGRGDAVCEQDLLDSLNNGELSHAYLDVYETEPLPEDHPFWTSDKITMTPHISAVSKMYLPRAMDIFTDNLKEYLKGGSKFTNLIDLDRGY